MNKKAQYVQSSEGPSPLLFIGIFIFVLPLLGMIVNWTVPKWISGIGMAVIILGIIHSLFIQWRN